MGETKSILEMEGVTKAMKTLYICEASGSDEGGSGTQEKPFRSALRALEEDEQAELVVRKALEGDDAVYAPISGAALKKAKKGLEISLPWGSLGRAVLSFLPRSEIEMVLRSENSGPLTGRPRPARR